MRHNTISPCFRVVSTFDLPPLQGASLRGQVPGLKPWAESYSPFGAKTSRVTSCKCLNCRPRVNPGLCFFGRATDCKSPNSRALYLANQF